MPPRLALRAIDLFERPVVFTAPFRFGAATVRAAPQAFVRVEIDIEGRGRAVGATAEMMMPKWFDKRSELDPETTIDELRQSLGIARDLYLADRGHDSAFGHHAAHIGAQVETCRRADVPALAAAFGPAEIDKAILDALLRGLGLDVFEGLARNIVGLDARLTPDLDAGAIQRFLASRRPLDAVAVRHTVGLLDDVQGAQGPAAVARATGCRFFKLKLGGDVAADRARLATIGAELAAIEVETWVTLDANEQYAAEGDLVALLDRLDHDAALAPIARRLLHIEQPLPRDRTFAKALPAGQNQAVIIDEADDGYAAFLKARALGYRGVSAKACKGLYKSLLNGVRAESWSAEDGVRFFLSAEDLTCQAGLAVQQDTALAAFLGLAHAERNGHHYGPGFGAASAAEVEAFTVAHPDLYRMADGSVRLRIEDGALSIGSFHRPGFATGAHPPWEAFAPLGQPSSRRSMECTA